MSVPQKLFAVTIFAYKKPGMDEDEYHKYIMETHAGHLKELLVKNKIVSYTMVRCPHIPNPRESYVDLTKQHNTSSTKSLIQPIFGDLPAEKVADYDAVVQIVFRDVEDYVKVRQDPHYKQVVVPDHDNFADGRRTKFVTGSFVVHVADGKLV